MFAVAASCPSCGLYHAGHAPCPIGLSLVPALGETLPIGSELAERYQVFSLLHRGPMSTVYRVLDQVRAGQPVILKELVLDAVPAEEREEVFNWFLREAHLLSMLRHPSLPRLFASFSERDRSYLVMEEVPGRSLEEYARHRDRLTEDQIVHWGIELCEVLHFLHTRPDPIVYRDLKPANILQHAETKTLMLVDFGVARAIAVGVPGTAVGTPGYAAPEQYQGLADARSDIYALGATLHCLLTGYDSEHEPPFRHPPVRQLNPAVTERTAAVIDRALSLNPEVRYRTALEMFDALRGALFPSPEMAWALTAPFYRSISVLPFVTTPISWMCCALYIALVGQTAYGTSLLGTVLLAAMLMPALLYVRPLALLRRRVEQFPGQHTVRTAASARRLLLFRIVLAMIFWLNVAIFSAVGLRIALPIAFVLWCISILQAERSSHARLSASSRAARLLQSRT
jgi:aminoglycoside phosphotransferase